ncbi:MAG: hypothetical protein KDC84_13540 [Crocinitomicaceae bacterium]|nr:hypothetical protein [Crocinitomicaceae bacterium]
MIDVRTTASPILKTQLRAEDKRQQLMLAVRIYRNAKQIDRFNYYVKDYGNPVYLLRNELKTGTVVNHPLSIRYNELIEFLKSEIFEIVKNELLAKTLINREHVKKLIDKVVMKDFNSAFVAKIDQQKVIITGSGYLGKGDHQIDIRAKTAINKMDFPTEPTFDPNGQIYNEIDAEDIESLMLQEDLHLRQEAEKLRISKLTTKERYESLEYDTQNIFELFGSIYHEPKLSSTYNKIVIRLFEYRFYMKPKEHVNHYDEQWVASFFEFLHSHGYTKLNTKIFDPLRFNPDIFVNKAVDHYKSDNLYTLLEILQRVSNHFADKGLLKRLNFKAINLKDICGEEQSEEGSRDEHALDNSEFNKLFFLQFNRKQLAAYQSIFDRKKIEKGNGKVRFKNLKISIADLESTRDLFCLQVMAGGIRGYRDLMTLKFNSVDKQVSFNVMKAKNRLMVNPYNVYIAIIARDYKNKLPELNFSYSANSMETIYRMLCQTVAEIVPLRREVIHENELIQISDLFNPYFARKTFSQILSDEYGKDDDEIMMFTGHKSLKSKSILRQNYLKKNSITKKRKIIKDIKLPKGKSQTTIRFARG